MTNGKYIDQLAAKYSKQVLAQAGIVALGRYLVETTSMPEKLAFSIAQIAYENELSENSYLFASLSDEVES